jgi:hypothetical protein
VGGWERRSSGASGDISGYRSETASCTGSKKVVGGGFDTTGVTDPLDIVIIRSGPNSSSDGWVVEAISVDKSFAITAYAFCIDTN